MKIISANLNGIRSAATKGFFPWLQTLNADIICVQETKIQAAQMTPAFLNPAGEAAQYVGHFHYAEKAGYSGVGIYVKTAFANIAAVRTGLQACLGEAYAMLDAAAKADCALFDGEGRWVEVDLLQKNDKTLTAVSAYFPSGSSSEDRHALKFNFLALATQRMAQLSKQGSEAVLCGDVNIAHQNIDLKNWKGNLKNSGFTAPERAWMTQTLAGGWCDVQRQLQPGVETYTWWSNRGGAWDKNVGWRIDYQLATPVLAVRAQTASVWRETRFSDHAPLIINYAD